MQTVARLFLILALSGAGCTTQPSPPPQVNLSGYSASFKQGYADGCERARSLLPRKDEQRFRYDGDYAMGWNDGYSVCTRRGR